jgi:hypothetical protein
MIPTFLRPFLAAILAPILLSLAGQAAAHGITITDAQVHEAVDYLVTWVIPIMAGLSVVIRRVIDKWANPGNAASSHVAAVEKELSVDLKRSEKSAKIDAIVNTDPLAEAEVPPLAKIPAKERGDGL